MSSDYGYINARIRAMKSFLLKEEDYHSALRQRTRGEYISFLSSLPAYANDGGDLKLNICRIFRKIIKFSSGEPNRLIHFILTPWDIYNLKTIVRGILNLRDRERIIQALIPAGKWDLVFLNSLVDSRDLKELADKLHIEMDRPLEEIYFRMVIESLTGDDYNSKVVLDYISMQIDFLNIRLAILGSKPEDILQKFDSSPYPWLAHEGLDLYNRTKRLSSIERLFRNRLFSHCLSLYTNSDPLSIAIPLAYINFKENEISNLRLIGEAIHFGMPMELVKEELIYAR